MHQKLGSSGKRCITERCKRSFYARATRSVNQRGKKRGLERCNPLRSLYWVTVARRSRFRVGSDRLERTEDHCDCPQDARGCHRADSSTVCVLATETTTGGVIF